MILRNIDKHTTRLINLESVSPDMKKMYAQFGFVFYLNLQF